MTFGAQMPFLHSGGGFPACSFGLSATSQQYFYLRTNQPPAISQQYFSLGTNQHQPPATSQTNMFSFSCPDAMNPTRTTANNLAPIFISSSSLMKQTLTRTHITYQQINHVMEFKEKCAILKQSKKNFKKRLKSLAAEERNDRGSRFSVRLKSRGIVCWCKSFKRLVVACP
jgi:hypothetical protein